MKMQLIVWSLLAVSGMANGQTQQSQVDSVSRLIMKYFDKEHEQRLYDLSGPAFQKALPYSSFQQVFDNNLAPLGKLEDLVLMKFENGAGTYKAVFSSATLTMILSLDSNRKFEAFLFQPYQQAHKVKNNPAASDNAELTALDKQVDQVLRPYIQQENTVGLSVGIITKGKIYYYDYGETARGDGRMPGPETIYEIGSISKTFTATLLAVAVESGLAKLDDPINKYLPDSIPPLQFEGRFITLENLSNHTSGIPSLPPDFGIKMKNLQNPYMGYSTNDLYSFLKGFHLTGEPGKLYEYSNAAVGLLGTILQKVLKGSYQDLIIKYICNPLGMSDTRLFIRKGDSSRFAKGYNEEGAYNPPWDLPPSFAGAGAIRSTVKDMMKYAQGNMDDAPAFLSKAFELTHDSTFSNGQFTLGLGWHYIIPGKQKILFHNGETGGFRSYLGINTHEDFAVVILSNCAMSVDDEGNRLMAWLENN